MIEYKKFMAITCDKLLLVVASIIISALLFIFFNHLLSKQIMDAWIDFMSGCVIYVLGFIYLFIDAKILKKYPSKYKVATMSFLFIILPIAIFYILFSYNLIPMPKRLSVYLLFSILLVPSFFMLFENCLGSWIKKK